MSNLYNLFKTVGEVYKFVDCNSKQQAINLSKNNPIVIAIYDNTMYYKGKVLTFKRQCAPKENKLIVCKSLPYNLQKGNNYYFNKTVNVNATKLNAEEIKSIHNRIVNEYSKYNYFGELSGHTNITLSIYIQLPYSTQCANRYTYIDTLTDNFIDNFIKEETASKFKYTLFVRFNFDTNSGTSELPFLIYSNQNTTLKEVDNINMKVLSNMYKDSCSKEGLYIDACVVRAKNSLQRHYILYYRKVRRYDRNKSGDKSKHKLKLVRSYSYNVPRCIRERHPNNICYIHYIGRNKKRCLFSETKLIKYTDNYQ